jgi:hypothetical protein
MLPSGLPGQFQQTLTIDSVTGGSGNKMTIGGENCIAGEDCMYYIAVGISSQSSAINTNPNPVYGDPLFTITASRTGEVVLIPCDSNFGDGVRFQSVDQGSSTYELCGNGGSATSVVVALEQCVGSSMLYACAGGGGGPGACKDVLPSSKAWGWRVGSSQTCSLTGSKQQCAAGSEVSLPRLKGGSYFLSTASDEANGGGGDTRFELQVIDDLSSLPLLVLPGSGAGSRGSANPVESAPVTGGVKLTWQTTSVLMPGMKSAMTTIGLGLRYSAYFIRADATGSTGRYNTRSFCGLAAAVSDQRGVEKKVFALDNVEEGQESLA